MRSKSIFLLCISLCFLIIWGCGSTKTVVSTPKVVKTEPAKTDTISIVALEKDAPEDSFFLSLLVSKKCPLVTITLYAAYF